MLTISLTSSRTHETKLGNKLHVFRNRSKHPFSAVSVSYRFLPTLWIFQEKYCFAILDTKPNAFRHCDGQMLMRWAELGTLQYWKKQETEFFHVLCRTCSSVEGLKLSKKTVARLAYKRFLILNAVHTLHRKKHTNSRYEPCYLIWYQLFWASMSV